MKVFFGRKTGSAIIGTLMLGCATGAHAGEGGVQSPSVQVAHAFLLDLESRRTRSAIQRLHPSTRQDYGNRELEPRLTLGRSGGFRRQFLSERGVEYETVVSFHARGLPGRGQYRIVCFVDLPVSGFGSVRYTSVLMGQGRSEPGWSVLSYRIRSSADPEC